MAFAAFGNEQWRYKTILLYTYRRKCPNDTFTQLFTVHFVVICNSNFNHVKFKIIITTMSMKNLNCVVRKMQQYTWLVGKLGLYCRKVRGRNNLVLRTVLFFVRSEYSKTTKTMKNHNCFSAFDFFVMWTVK